MKTKEISCLICNKKDTEVIIKRDFPRHHICKNCGFVYMNPIIEFNENIEFYENEYWEERQGIEKKPDIEEAKEYSRTIALGDWLKPYLNHNCEVLEIGAGHGYHLNYLRKISDCKVCAIEPSKAGAKHMQSILNIEAYQTTLEKFEAKREFDIVILSHVLEHFENPQLALRLSKNLLKAGGIIWIEVPNILYPNPRKHLNNWLAKEHISYFSKNKLHYLLSVEGFELIKNQEDIFVRLMARKSEGTPAEKVLNEYDSVKQSLSRHDKQYQWHRLLKLPAILLNKFFNYNK